VPRGSAKRKSGPSPEMPIAKKPVHEQNVAPIAPMLAGQVNTFDASPPAANNNTTTAWTNGAAKQDGMFRNSTVNDFNSMTGMVNVNPLSSRTPQASRSTSNGAQSSPSRAPAPDWVLDPALMDSGLGGTDGHISQRPEEDEDYADAQDALLAYYQSNGLPPASSQESANQFMNGFVDYEAGQRQPKQEMEIDPMLENAIGEVQRYNEERGPLMQVEGAMDVNGWQDNEAPRLTNGHQEPPLDPALATSPPLDHNHSNGLIMPSTEDHPLKQQESREVQPPSPLVKRRLSSALPQTPKLNGAVHSASPEANRGSGKTPSRRKESSVLEEADEDTKKLIEALRQEDLQMRGLRRRS
jgi:hypothetical protein